MCFLFNPNNSVSLPLLLSNTNVGYSLTMGYQKKGVWPITTSDKGISSLKGAPMSCYQSVLVAAKGWVHDLGGRGWEWAPARSTLIPFFGGKMRIRAFTDFTMFIYLIMENQILNQTA